MPASATPSSPGSSFADARAVRVAPPNHWERERIADHYVLLREIAKGGMGAVWIARHERLGVQVAIKFVHHIDSKENVERLMREARAAAGIDHPAVVRVLDALELDDGEPCIVMEYLDGESLAERIDGRGAMDPVEAVRTLLPIAGALAAAHARGVIHRDVKADNIMLARSAVGTQPKLIDFGVARLSDTRRITRTGRFVGTPDYASPEQLMALDLDGRSDVWGFGVLLYECIAGVLPFDRPTQSGILHAIIGEEPDPLDRAGVDADLSRIVHRALAKDRDDRWPSVAEMGTALARWLVERGVTEDVSGAALRAAWPISYGRAMVSPPPEAQAAPPALDEREREVPSVPQRSTDSIELPMQRASRPVLALFAALAIAALIGVTLMISHTRPGVASSVAAVTAVQAPTPRAAVPDVQPAPPPAPPDLAPPAEVPARVRAARRPAASHPARPAQDLHVPTGAPGNDLKDPYAASR